MPLEQLVPLQPALWDQVLFWPARRTITNSITNAATELSARAGAGNAVSGGTQATAIITVGTGGVTGFQEHPTLLIPGYRQTYVGPGGNPGVLNWPSMSLPRVWDAAAIAPGVRMPESNRFQWYRYYFDLAGAGVFGTSSGIGFSVPANASALAWPDSGAAGFPGFALVGDGAGGLQFRVQNAAGGLVEAFAVPAGLFVAGRINLFEVRALDGAPGRNASVTMLLNGTQILSRNWVVAPALPRIGGAATSGPGALQSRIFDVNVALWTFHVEYRSGAYDNEQVPVSA